jgi:hypothetical protein
MSKECPWTSWRTWQPTRIRFNRGGSLPSRTVDESSAENWHFHVTRVLSSYTMIAQWSTKLVKHICKCATSVLQCLIPGYASSMRLGEPIKSQYGRFREQQNIWPLPGIRPRHSQVVQLSAQSLQSLSYPGSSCLRHNTSKCSQNTKMLQTIASGSGTIPKPDHHIRGWNRNSSDHSDIFIYTGNSTVAISRLSSEQ